MTVLIGGVGELYQGDLDLGRIAVERLEAEPLGEDVLVEELSYGAVAVVQRVQELAPSALVLVGADRRGHAPGHVERVEAPPADAPVDPATVQRAVVDAVTGYVGMEMLVIVGRGFRALPAHTVMITVEPERCEPGEELTAAAAAGLERALDMVRAELLTLAVEAGR